MDTIKVHKLYREHLKKLGCLLYNQEGWKCLGVKEIHHVRNRDGLGRRPEDIIEGKSRLICMCTFHHSLFHTMGRKSFEYKYKINLKQTAQYLYKDYLGELCEYG